MRRPPIAERCNANAVAPAAGKELKFAEKVRVGFTPHLRREVFAALKAFRIFSVEELLSSPPPEWLIEGLFETESQVVLYGAPASGKSFVALDWALSIASGQSWHGRPVKQGPIVYIAAEGGKGITKRVQAWQQHRGLSNIQDAGLIVEPIQLFQPPPLPASVRVRDEIEDLSMGLDGRKLRPVLFVRRVNLAKWAGIGKKKINRSEAIEILAEVRGAILTGEFDPAGKAVPKGERTFGNLLDDFDHDYVMKRRADGKLRSSSFNYYIAKFRSEFSSEKLCVLEQAPRRFEIWLDSLTFSTGPKGKQTIQKLRPASWNRYYEHGRRIFNWAIAQGYATANPFVKFSKRPERNKRETRILPEQEKALFEALPKLWRKRQRTEIRRRLIAAIDLGLREGEMLKVQVKHIDFTSWRITLPPESAKGGATTDRAEFVYAMTSRIREVLRERKELGPDKFVFGAESGAYVASFDKSWRELFKHAGLPVGRRSGLTWHDLRHEFVSFLADQGGEIREVKEAARHKDIRTTERYMKAREERLKALMGRMADRSA